MRSTSTPPSRRRWLLAIALACAAVLVAGSIAPAFGALYPAPAPLTAPVKAPNKALKLAQKALRLAKRANTNSGHALNVVRRAGPTGPQGPRGSEGLDGPQGPDGEAGSAGATGPGGSQGLAGTNGTNGAPGATGPQGPQGPSGYARAFATIKPDATLVSARSAGVTGVSRPTDDHYCLAVGTIDVTRTSPLVSVDLGLSTGTPSTLFATVDSSGTGCAADQIAVVTAGPTANVVAFTILVP